MSLQPSPSPTLAPPEKPGANGPAPSPLPAAAHPGRLPRGGKRAPGRWLAYGAGLAGLLVVMLFAAQALGVVRLWGDTSRPDLILHKVQYERIQLTITERGQLESAENSDIVCRVKARSANSTVATTIRYLFVEDGQMVKKGEKLVQLDDSGLVEQLKTQDITV